MSYDVVRLFDELVPTKTTNAEEFFVYVGYSSLRVSRGQDICGMLHGDAALGDGLINTHSKTPNGR